MQQKLPPPPHKKRVQTGKYASSTLKKVLTVIKHFKHKNYSECMLTYGENCQHSCSVLCFNKTCDRINGSCLYGCKCGKQCDEGIHVSK